MIISFEIKGHECLIDSDDVDLLERCWYANEKERLTYIVRTSLVPKRHHEYMHRLILERAIGRQLTKAEFPDHIDRNGLNNTRSNLRVSSVGQNRANSPVSKNNKLGVKGVSKQRDKFRANIRSGGKLIHLGMFDTVQEAHDAYIEAAKKYHGEFARGE